MKIIIIRNDPMNKHHSSIPSTYLIKKFETNKNFVFYFRNRQNYRYIFCKLSVNMAVTMIMNHDMIVLCRLAYVKVLEEDRRSVAICH